MADYPHPTPVSTYIVTLAIVAIVVGAGAYLLAADMDGVPGVAQKPAIEAPTTPGAVPGTAAAADPTAPTR